MTIQVGDKVPSVPVKQLTESGIQDLNTEKVFANKKIVLFAVPGAFTPTCSAKHLPGYAHAAEAFKSLGIELVCLAVNDPFVMQAWFASTESKGVKPLSDGNATFAKALGLEMDGGAYGLGIRSQRFALYAENGIVKALEIEAPGAFDVSSAEHMLDVVKKQ